MEGSDESIVKRRRIAEAENEATEAHSTSSCTVTVGSCDEDTPSAALVELDCSNASLMDQVIYNHLILKEIFKHLPVPALLDMSLVNKLWNSSARTVLRENKKCLVKIGRDKPCVYLQEFLHVLRDSAEIPFNGLSIMTRSPYEDDHDCIDCDDTSELYIPLLTQMNIKYLEIGWDDELGCPAINVLEKVFTERASNLEALYLHELPFAVESISEYFFGEKSNLSQTNSISSDQSTKIWLPKLKTLELPGEDFTYDVSRFPIIRELIQSAPSLRNLLGGIQSKFIDFFFLLEKVHVVKEYLFQPGNKTYNNLQNEIQNQNPEEPVNQIQDNFVFNEIRKDLQASLKFAKESPKLLKLTISTEHMKVKILQDPVNSFDEISEILKLLLEASSHSLEQLEISHLDLILLQRIQIPQLSHVRHLLFTHNRSLDSHEGYNTLARIDFSAIFPNLESIEIGGASVDELNFYLTDEFRQNPIEYSCPTVKKLELAYGDNELEIQVNPLRVTLKDGNYQDIQTRYAKIFPNVKHFYIGHCKKLKNLCSSLWTAWKDLETIVITHVDDEVIFENLDSVFTGIPEEQCDALRESKASTGFEKFQTTTSIQNLTNLKKLRIEIDHENTCTKRFHRNIEGPLNSQPCLLSEITCKSALALMPDLEVEIVRRICRPWKMKCRFALEHLKPYVSLVNSGPPEYSDVEEDFSTDSDTDDSEAFLIDSNSSEDNNAQGGNGFDAEAFGWG